METNNHDNGPIQHSETTPATTPDGQLDEVIQQAVAQLRGIYQILPDFVPTPAEGLNVMRTASSVPDEFLEASAVTAEDDTTMQTMTGLDPVRARMVITRNLRFEPLAAAAEAFARDVRYNMFRERWEVVKQALQVYSLAKSQTRNARGGSLVAHVHAMQTALGRKGRSRKAKPEPTESTPAEPATADPRSK